MLCLGDFMKKFYGLFFVCSIFIILFNFLSCATIPENSMPVSDFSLNNYLGDWYEIARLDNRYEKGMIYTSASYMLDKNGSIKVINYGYLVDKKEWKTVTATARYRKGFNIGELKISFFYPFYTSYNILAIDDDYSYALVVGSNLKYLWILSRTTSIPDSIKQKYLEIAKTLGYPVEDLIWVEHNIIK
jgi:apolipoprotein D and lipocalin family protein